MKIELPLADAFTVGISIVGIVAVVLAVAALVSVLRNSQLSGGAKVMWVVIVLFVPILGSVVYFGVRGDW
jgi:hypothetical protein